MRTVPPTEVRVLLSIILHALERTELVKITAREFLDDNTEYKY